MYIVAQRRNLSHLPKLQYEDETRAMKAQGPGNMRRRVSFMKSMKVPGKIGLVELRVSVGDWYLRGGDEWVRDIVPELDISQPSCDSYYMLYLSLKQFSAKRFPLEELLTNNNLPQRHISVYSDNEEDDDHTFEQSG